MQRFRPRRPSTGTVVALIALFVALGGVSYAAATITGADIKNGSITGKDVKNGSLTGKDVKKGSLTAKQIKSGSLTGKQVKDGSLTGADVKTGSLTGTQVKASTLGQVPSAANADRLGGKTASDFQTRLRWILVQGTTTGANVLADSGGFGTVTRTGTGVYSVDAGQSVVRHSLTATLNINGGAGFVDVAPCGGSANNPGGITCSGVNDNTHVLVRTLSTAGAAADRTFYLVIGS